MEQWDGMGIGGGGGRGVIRYGRMERTQERMKRGMGQEWGARARGDNRPQPYLYAGYDDRLRATRPQTPRTYRINGP